MYVETLTKRNRTATDLYRNGNERCYDVENGDERYSVAVNTLRKPYRVGVWTYENLVASLTERYWSAATRKTAVQTTIKL